MLTVPKIEVSPLCPSRFDGKIFHSYSRSKSIYDMPCLLQSSSTCSYLLLTCHPFGIDYSDFYLQKCTKPKYHQPFQMFCKTKFFLRVIRALVAKKYSIINCLEQRNLQLKDQHSKSQKEILVCHQVTKFSKIKTVVFSSCPSCLSGKTIFVY